MGYSERNAILRRLGYESYAAYLASPLWRAIRRRVLKRDGLNCCLCPAAATEVHHDDYGEAMLEGRSISRLFSVCGKCHDKIEFHGTGDKRTFCEAQHALALMLKARAKAQVGGVQVIRLRRSGAIPRASGIETTLPRNERRRRAKHLAAELFQLPQAVMAERIKAIADPTFRAQVWAHYRNFHKAGGVPAYYRHPPAKPKRKLIAYLIPAGTKAEARCYFPAGQWKQITTRREHRFDASAAIGLSELTFTEGRFQIKLPRARLVAVRQ